MFAKTTKQAKEGTSSIEMMEVSKVHMHIERANV